MTPRYRNLPHLYNSLPSLLLFNLLHSSGRLLLVALYPLLVIHSEKPDTASAVQTPARWRLSQYSTTNSTEEAGRHSSFSIPLLRVQYLSALGVDVDSISPVSARR